MNQSKGNTFQYERTKAPGISPEAFSLHALQANVKLGTRFLACDYG